MISLPTAVVEARPKFSDLSVLLYGQPKVGKTSFVANIPELLIVDTEKGARFQSTYRVEVSSWAEFKALTEAARGAANLPYKIIALDTLTNLADWCMAAVMKRLGAPHPSDLAYGKGWDAVKQEWVSTINTIKSSGFSVWYVCHEVTREVTKGAVKFPYTQPDLSQFLLRHVLKDCDIIGRASAGMKYRETVVNGKPQVSTVQVRTFQLKPSRDVCAGGRFVAGLPNEISFESNVFIAAVNDALAGLAPKDLEEKEVDLGA